MGRIDALACHQQHGHGTLDQLLCITDALDHIIPLVDHSRHQLRRIDVAAAHLHKMSVPALKKFLYDFIFIIDLTHRRDRVSAQYTNKGTKTVQQKPDTD